MKKDIQSQNTKKRMAEALSALIQVKKFSKITVEDLVTSCRINRNTFYNHFDNMYDLLYYTYNLYITELISLFQQSKAPITEVFDHILLYIDKNMLLSQAAYESLGESDFRNMLDHNIRCCMTEYIDFICENGNTHVSKYYREFILSISTQMSKDFIVGYIKYYSTVDKETYTQYINTFLFSSLEAAIKEGSEKKL